MTVYQAATVSLEFNESKQLLVQKWKGFSPSDIFREAIDQSLSFTAKNKVKAILSDTLEQSVVKPEDTEYAASATPKLFLHGVKAMAFVMPKNVLTQLSLKSFGSQNKSEKIQFFSSVSDAEKWLEEVAN
jgi:hypothetical protein